MKGSQRAVREALTELVESTGRGVAALVVDEVGETVDWVSNVFEEEDLRLAGAYIALRMRGVVAGFADAGAGSVERLRLEREGLVLCAQRLDHESCIVLVQKRPGYVAQSRIHLIAAAERCDRALRPESVND